MAKTIEIKVVPNAKSNQVKEENGHLKVRVNAPPEKGKANKLLLKVLAKYFNTKKRNIQIIRGATAQVKTIRIAD